MKTSEIKYNLSTDYDKLYKLLKEGCIIAGFIAIDIDGIPNKEHSKIVMMFYIKEYKMFDLGFSFFEKDFDKIGFNKLCEKNYIMYFDLKS